MSEPTQFARITRRGGWLPALLVDHARNITGLTSSRDVEIAEGARSGKLLVLDIPGPARGYAVLRDTEPTLQLHVVDGEDEEAYMALFDAVLVESNGAAHVVPVDQVSQGMFNAIDAFGGAYGILLSDDRQAADPGSIPSGVDPVSVTIDYNDGANELKKLLGARGALFDQPSDPGMDGAEFDSWRIVQDDSQPGEVFDFSQPVTEDVTVVATWRQAASADGSPDADKPVEGTDSERTITDEEVAASQYGKMRRVQLEAIAKERSVFIPKKIDDLRRALLDHDDTSEPYDV